MTTRRRSMRGNYNDILTFDDLWRLSEGHSMLLDAWNVVQGHAMLEGIVSLNPPSIKDGGACAPFDQAAFAIAIAAELGYYTCAINLAWVNLFWSATPGTPIRESAVELVMETSFKVPTALDVIVAVPDKGALMRVSPEELTTAFVLAVARDIAKGEANTAVQQWKDFMLSTACKLVLLIIPMDRAGRP